MERNYTDAVHSAFASAAMSTLAAKVTGQRVPAPPRTPREPLPTYDDFKANLTNEWRRRHAPQFQVEEVDRMLDEIYAEYGLKRSDRPKAESQFPVYVPKSSAEYFDTMLAKPERFNFFHRYQASHDSNQNNATPSLKDAGGHKECNRIRNTPSILDDEDVEDNEEDEGGYKPTGHPLTTGSRVLAGMYRLSPEYRRVLPAKDSETMLIDYSGFRTHEGGFKHNPHTRSLYSRPHLVHPRDSRYLGSDFVILKLRGQDDFYRKCDKLLDNAKKL